MLLLPCPKVNLGQKNIFDKIKWMHSWMHKRLPTYIPTYLSLQKNTYILYKHIHIFFFFCYIFAYLLASSLVYTVGLTLWNISCLEFKFDDTRLSYWHKNKIGRIENFFCCFLTLLIFCPVSWVSFAETSQQGRKLAKSGSNKKKSILPILFLCQ